MLLNFSDTSFETQKLPRKMNNFIRVYSFPFHTTNLFANTKNNTVTRVNKQIFQIRLIQMIDFNIFWENSVKFQLRLFTTPSEMFRVITQIIFIFNSQIFTDIDFPHIQIFTQKVLAIYQIYILKYILELH